MKIFRTAERAAAILAVLTILAVVGISIAQPAKSQTGVYLPVPSGIFSSAGAVVTAQDANNITAVAAVASGQVLTSAGVGAQPVWSASPTLTSLTLGSSGTAVTQIRVYSPTITPASVAAVLCAEQTFTVTGLTTADKVFYNPVATGNAASAGQVRVSAADTLAVTYCNPTAGALTPAAGVAGVVAVRS